MSILQRLLILEILHAITAQKTVFYEHHSSTSALYLILKGDVKYSFQILTLPMIRYHRGWYFLKHYSLVFTSQARKTKPSHGIQTHLHTDLSEVTMKSFCMTPSSCQYLFSNHIHIMFKLLCFDRNNATAPLFGCIIVYRATQVMWKSHHIVLQVKHDSNIMIFLREQYS